MQYQEPMNRQDAGLIPKLACIFMIGLLSLSVFLSSSLVSLSYDLAPSSISERIVWAAEAWHSWMVRFGADIPMQWAEGTMEAIASQKLQPDQ